MVNECCTLLQASLISSIMRYLLHALPAITVPCRKHKKARTISHNLLVLGNRDYFIFNFLIVYRYNPVRLQAVRRWGQSGSFNDYFNILSCYTFCIVIFLCGIMPIQIFDLKAFNLF